MTLTTRPIALRWVDPRSHDDAIVQLHLEYMTWVAKEIEAAFGLTEQALYGMTTAQYVNNVKDQVCGDAPPLGTFYAVDAAGELAGMGGFRRLRQGVAEIKRIYVRPEHRGKQVGRTLLQRLLSDAQAFGFTQVVLDSAPFMQSAQRLYRSLGFVDCPAYEGTEVPDALQASWCFMGLRF